MLTAAQGVVVKTGDDTVMGCIAGLVATLDSGKSPINKEISMFVNLVRQVQPPAAILQSPSWTFCLPSDHCDRPLYRSHLLHHRHGHGLRVSCPCHPPDHHPVSQLYPGSHLRHRDHRGQCSRGEAGGVTGLTVPTPGTPHDRHHHPHPHRQEDGQEELPRQEPGGCGDSG